MHQQLPQKIYPFKYARNSLELSGRLKVSDMPRLSDAVYRDEGVVMVNMDFNVNEAGTPYILGNFTSSLTLICERCMEIMCLNVTAKCLLELVEYRRNIRSLTEGYEPWLVSSNEPVSIITVVEDELLLALPLVPSHDFDCLPAESWISENTRMDQEKPTSPFAVLSALKS